MAKNKSKFKFQFMVRVVIRLPLGFCSWGYSFQYLLKLSHLFEWNDSVIYLNPIKFRILLIFARFIVAPLIFAQLNSSYIRALLIFAHWQNLNFRVGLSYEICAEEKSANYKWWLSKICGIYLCKLKNVSTFCEI